LIAPSDAVHIPAGLEILLPGVGNAEGCAQQEITYNSFEALDMQGALKWTHSHCWKY